MHDQQYPDKLRGAKSLHYVTPRQQLTRFDTGQRGRAGVFDSVNVFRTPEKKCMYTTSTCIGSRL